MLEFLHSISGPATEPVSSGPASQAICNKKTRASTLVSNIYLGDRHEFIILGFSKPCVWTILSACEDMEQHLNIANGNANEVTLKNNLSLKKVKHTLPM
jgi:hypothetical protein